MCTFLIKEFAFCKPKYYTRKKTFSLGVVHKLRLAFFDHLPPCMDIFFGMNVDKKWTFLDHLSTSSCKRSL